MTKTRSSMKILACLMAVVAVLCSFAISASAMEPGNYTPKLSVDSYVPHELNFFENDTVTVSEDRLSVIATLKDPAYVIVTPPGSSTSYTAEGRITSVTLADSSPAGYTVEFANDVLTITTSELIDADQFKPVLTFEVDIISTEGTVTRHQTVNATMTLIPQQ